MRRIEDRPSLRTVLAAPNNPLFLTLGGRERNSRLGIVEPAAVNQGYGKEIQSLVRTLMLLHLIARELPERIETNFEVEYTTLLEGLYRHYGRPAPVIGKADGARIEVEGEGSLNDVQIDDASALSGGADSAYRVANLVASGKNVVGIHIQNLNKAPASEFLASQNQCKAWGVVYERVKLLNSSGNSGYETMRTRDLLIGGICAMVAAKYGALEVQIEGGMIGDPEACEYSESTQTWEAFNRILTFCGMGLQVVGVDPGDLETIGEIIKIEKSSKLSVIPLIQNCFSAPHQLPNNRRKWERETPHLAECSPAQWCGSCSKCRRMSLGRIFYNDPNLGRVPEAEKAEFVRDTRLWMKKYSPNASHVSESFRVHLQLLSQDLGLGD